MIGVATVDELVERQGGHPPRAVVLLLDLPQDVITLVIDSHRGKNGIPQTRGEDS